VVAVGNLDRIWLEVPENVAEQELKDAFRSYFGAAWTEVLDAVEKSFAYIAANNVYFAVRNLRTADNLSLEQLLEQKGIGRQINIIVS
jgi:hypothetical protein